tara:strand:- start:78669 stop:79562 length:894 start_codon:yes stop_codon:yes gene_type:complete
MIDFSETCILTGSTDNLNTSMVISFDEEEYKVIVSDEAEDNATPKAIKAALKIKIAEKLKEKEAKKEKLKELLEIAKELGFELTPTRPSAQNSLIIPTQIQEGRQPAVAMHPPPDLSNSPIIEQKGAKFVVQRNSRNNTKGDGLTAEEAAASLENAKRRSVGGAGRSAGSQAGRHSSHHLPQEVQTRSGETFQRPEQITKKNQVVKGRLGIPTTIPKTLMGTDGTTEIEIVNTGGNEALKRRMQVLNEARMQAEARGVSAGDQPIDSLNACPSCDGVGKVKGRSCVRCSGMGWMGYV